MSLLKLTTSYHNLRRSFHHFCWHQITENHLVWQEMTIGYPNLENHYRAVKLTFLAAPKIQRITFALHTILHTVPYQRITLWLCRLVLVSFRGEHCHWPFWVDLAIYKRRMILYIMLYYMYVINMKPGLKGRNLIRLLNSPSIHLCTMKLRGSFLPDPGLMWFCIWPTLTRSSYSSGLSIVWVVFSKDCRADLSSG